jgi:hypothetical protein
MLIKVILMLIKIMIIKLIKIWNFCFMPIINIKKNVRVINYDVLYVLNFLFYFT